MDITTPLSTTNISETDDDNIMSVSISSANGNMNAPHTKDNTIRTRIAPMVFYVLLFGIALGKLSTTLYAYPLFPLQPDSLEWSNAWLVTTVFDYYGACLCFGGIVLSSEPSWAQGLAWNTVFALVGSPACCLWVVLRLWKKGSLRLPDTTTSTISSARREA